MLTTYYALVAVMTLYMCFRWAANSNLNLCFKATWLVLFLASVFLVLQRLGYLLVVRA